MVVRSSFSFIPKDKFPFEKIKQDLVIETTNFVTGEDEIQIFYQEDKNHWIVPRFYPLAKKLQIEKEIVTEGQVIDIEDSIDFRDDLQEKAYRFLTNLLTTGKILKAPPGFGKTVITIKALSHLKLKPLIIVPSVKLALQWRERFIQFTNLTEDDFYIASGILDDGILDAKVVIALVQTLTSRFCKQDPEIHKLMFKANFGVTVFDECHTSVPTQKFHLANGLVYSKHVWGLSATPFKSDRRTKIIYYHLGFDLFDEADYQMKPKIIEIEFDSMIPAKTKKWICWNNTFSFTRYLKKLYDSEVFKKLLLAIIRKLYQQNRNILILVKFVKSVDEFAKLIENELGVKVGRFYAGQPNDELQHQIIVATKDSFKEGIDVPKLDTLIFADLIGGNRTAIEQVVGRILRKHENKQKPLAIFFADRGFDNLLAMHKNRCKVYDACGFEYEIKQIR